jgi:hypothetical protein
MSDDGSFPANLIGLHSHEESLREEALKLIAADERLQLHLHVIEAAMEIADMLRQYPTDDQNLKVIQLLGMRTFNALGSSLKLAMSGYGQNSALIMRDVLETVFLIDHFSGDRSLIERWRFADKDALRKEFSPVKVREALDARDGFAGKKRFEMYEMFSILAGHPNMNSQLMMRPEPGGDILIGPFIEATSLTATMAEMGRLAAQVGVHLDLFFPPDWAVASRLACKESRRRWMATFYPNAVTRSRT